MRRALPVFVRNKENDKKTAMKKMNIRKLIKQMTTQQKLAQLTQLNAVYISRNKRYRDGTERNVIAYGRTARLYRFGLEF